MHMRLLTKTTLYFLTVMVILLALSGFYLFSQFSKELNQRSDKELVADEISWLRYLKNGIENNTTFILRTPDLSIYPTEAPATTYPTITDASELVEHSNSRILYRQLSHVVSIGGFRYQVTIRKSQEQKAALVTNFTRIMLFVFGGTFLVAIIFNWAISKRLWKPFKLSLQKIRTAELQKMKAIHFEETDTKEFNELNASLNYMTGKMYADFTTMKEFTEDAAHEMQTPIAIVQSKLELLLQDDNLNDEQAGSVAEAAEALGRLGKLNESLLLLANIENNQYKAASEISLVQVTKKYLSLFSELIKDKQLAVETNYTDDCKMILHPLLADSLVANLIGNAVKYNYVGGSIKIRTDASSYSIGNTSLLSPIPTERLFKRFKASKNGEQTSNGLGLAIVKKIVDANNLSIEYEVKNGLHNFYIKK